MAQKFKKGDIVLLKSGGPKMTIKEYKWIVGWDTSGESDEVVICTWFNKEELQEREFQQDALHKVG